MTKVRNGIKVLTINADCPEEVRYFAKLNMKMFEDAAAAVSRELLDCVK